MVWRSVISHLVHCKLAAQGLPRSFEKDGNQQKRSCSELLPNAGNAALHPLTVSFQKPSSALTPNYSGGHVAQQVDRLVLGGGLKLTGLKAARPHRGCRGRVSESRSLKESRHTFIEVFDKLKLNLC